MRAHNPAMFVFNRHQDLGKLILRLGMGGMFMVHGWPKLIGGPDTWKKLGSTMASLGLDFLPEFWGFMAAFSEFFGGLAFALGILFQPACALLAITMAVAANMHLQAGDGVSGASHAIESGLVFLGALLIGPGRLRLRRPGSAG